MRSRIGLLAALVLAVAGVAATPAVAQGHDNGHHKPPRDYDAEIHDALASAKSAAGFDHLGTLNRLCFLPPVNGEPSTDDKVPGYVADPSTAPARDTWYADPAQVFDDLYFVGGSKHSSWALKTSDGIILIDTIYPYNSQELILDGMRKLGLDPADIKYIVVSHAHGDHIGGVELVQNASGAPVVMGAADWDLVKRFPKRYTSMTPDASTGIRIDKPTDLKLGRTTLHIIPTPGHTQGTLGYTFTVHDFGHPVTVAYSGGTALSMQNDKPDPGIANLQQYIDSQKAMRTAAARSHATVLLSNHSEFDSAAAKTKMLPGRGFGPHPFVNGEEFVKNYFDVGIQCAKAVRLGLEKTAAGE